MWTTKFNAYAVETLKKADVLIMGRRTYELMAGYWPTATDNDPAVTFLMNDKPGSSGVLANAQAHWTGRALPVSPPGSIAELKWRA